MTRMSQHAQNKQPGQPARPIIITAFSAGIPEVGPYFETPFDCKPTIDSLEDLDEWGLIDLPALFARTWPHEEVRAALQGGCPECVGMQYTARWRAPTAEELTGQFERRS